MSRDQPTEEETLDVNKSTATLAVCVLVASVAVQALAQNTPAGKSPIQPTNATQPAATTAAPAVVPVRVAVLNTNKVLKQFNKAQQMNNFIQGIVQSYGQQINNKRDEGTKLNAELQKTVDPVQGENIKKRITQLEREMQDLDAEARKEISSKQGSIAIEIFKNIEEVTQRVAIANGFDLVLACPDATNEQDLYSQPNVVRSSRRKPPCRSSPRSRST